MQVKSIAECSKGEHSAILPSFIKLQFVVKIFVWSFLSGRLRQVLLYGERFKSIFFLLILMKKVKHLKFFSIDLIVLLISFLIYPRVLSSESSDFVLTLVESFMKKIFCKSSVLLLSSIAQLYMVKV